MSYFEAAILAARGRGLSLCFYGLEGNRFFETIKLLDILVLCVRSSRG